MYVVYTVLYNRDSFPIEGINKSVLSYICSIFQNADDSG